MRNNQNPVEKRPTTGEDRRVQGEPNYPKWQETHGDEDGWLEKFSETLFVFTARKILQTHGILMVLNKMKINWLY